MIKSCLAVGALLTIACGNAIAEPAREHSVAIDAAHNRFEATSSLKAGICAPSLPLPAGTSLGTPSASFTGIAYPFNPQEKFSATFWRAPCDATTSYLYLRVTPTAGTPFVCGSDFTAIVDGVQYEVKLAPAHDTSSFCGDVLVPTTVLVEQWSFNPQYDPRKAITLVYSSYDGYASQVSLAAQSGLPTPPISPTVGLWFNPLESGTGFTIDIHNGVLVVLVYTYKANGDSEWYLAYGSLTDNGTKFSAPLEKYRNGQCISCLSYVEPVSPGNDGQISITFTSANSAVVSLPGGRTTNIQPELW